MLEKQFRMKIKKDIDSCKTCVYRNLLFGSLDDIEYNLVNSARKELLISRGEIIKTENEEITSFLYLRKGLVKLFKTDTMGKERILSINKPGDFISLLHIFSNKKYPYSISALEETLVCEVDISVLMHLIKTNGNFALSVVNRMGRIADEIIKIRFEQSRLQIKGRVASIVLFFADHVYRKKTFKLPITRREIGELISMSTENTIRTFSEFKKDGIIKFEGKELTILDYDRLVNISKTG